MSQYASEVVSKPVGTELQVQIRDEEKQDGKVTEVEATVPIDDWPEPGETVTFNAVGGPVEKTVAEIDRDQHNPIRFEEGGVARRQNLEEYSTTELHKVIELADGTELWAGGEGSDN